MYTSLPRHDGQIDRLRADEWPAELELQQRRIQKAAHCRSTPRCTFCIRTILYQNHLKRQRVLSYTVGPSLQSSIAALFGPSTCSPISQSVPTAMSMRRVGMTGVPICDRVVAKATAMPGMSRCQHQGPFTWPARHWHARHSTGTRSHRRLTASGALPAGVQAGNMCNATCMSLEHCPDQRRRHTGAQTVRLRTCALTRAECSSNAGHSFKRTHNYKINPRTSVPSSPVSGPPRVPVEGNRA